MIIDYIRFASISIVIGYLLFPLYLEKMNVIGIYVVALKRTMINSAKLFPMFVCMFAGFLLSFNLRTNFNVRFFRFGITDENSDKLSNGIAFYSILRCIDMILGAWETDKMGLEETAPFLNYFIYFLFMMIMAVIFYNLFTGIAVGELETVLSKADVQQISTRIHFVLQIQITVEKFSKRFEITKQLLNMNYDNYKHGNDLKCVKTYNKIISKVKKFIFNSQHDISLAEGQNGLEDQI